MEKEKITEAETLEIAARLSTKLDEELSKYQYRPDLKDRILKALISASSTMYFKELSP